MTAFAASRRRWYSLSVSVIAGATVIESPVCTPIGSMFSIEQTTMKLSALSRMTSSSNSFQPSTLSSMSTSRVGDCASAQATFASNSALVLRDAAARAAHRERGPQDRREAGVLHDRPAPPRRSARCRPSGTSSPIFSIAALKSERSSAFAIDSGRAPSISTPYFASTPSLVEREREVQRRLPAEGRQDRVRALALDDGLERLRLERLDVRPVREVRIRHDRGRVRVDQDDLVALLPQRLGALRARSSRTRRPDR